MKGNSVWRHLQTRSLSIMLAICLTFSLSAWILLSTRGCWHYRERLKKHLDDKILKDMGVTLDDYFIYSFRLRGISVLSDGDVHPVFVQKNACHKRWDSTVNYINPSLSKALRANDLLAGNNLLEGLGSQYSGYPKFFALFLPLKSPLKFCQQMQIIKEALGLCHHEKYFTFCRFLELCWFSV